MVGHGGIEVAKTVLEVADLAWTAAECCHHHNHRQHDNQENFGDRNNESSLPDEELEYLQSENRRLRNLLEQNLNLLQNLSESPFVLHECPPDLHARLVSTIDSAHFLDQLKSLQKKSVDGTECKFLFKEASGVDLKSAEVLIDIGLGEPSWWLWVTDEMIPNDTEERSEIDSENYIIISEEQVVDGVANFMAKCILSNPKAQILPPEELQKTLTSALGGMNKLEKMLHVWHAGMMFYSLSTWGLALAGLYKSRAFLRLAANGVHTTSKFVLKVV